MGRSDISFDLSNGARAKNEGGRWERVVEWR